MTLMGDMCCRSDAKIYLVTERDATDARHLTVTAPAHVRREWSRGTSFLNLKWRAFGEPLCEGSGRRGLRRVVRAAHHHDRQVVLTGSAAAER